jgi:hypothetical protein
VAGPCPIFTGFQFTEHAGSVLAGFFTIGNRGGACQDQSAPLAALARRDVLCDNFSRLLDFDLAQAFRALAEPGLISGLS